MKESHDIEVIKHKVHFENECRKILNIEGPRMVKLFKEFEGQKLLKVTGELLQKVKDEIKFPEYAVTPLKKGDWAKVHWLSIKSTGYSITLELSLCFNGGHYQHDVTAQEYRDNPYYCEYYESVRYIASLQNGVLVKVEEDVVALPLLNVKEQIQYYEECKLAETNYKDARGKMFYQIANVLFKSLY